MKISHIHFFMIIIVLCVHTASGEDYILRNTIFTAGSGRSFSENYSTDIIFGQPITGNSSSEEYQGSFGYWEQNSQPSPVSIQFPVIQRWNMVSVPMAVDDYTKTVLFPTALSTAYSYQGGYTSESVLSNGKGYWMKFSGNQDITMTGEFLSEDTIEVTAGWNMIGSVSQTVATSAIGSVPGGMVTSQFFGYEGSYVASSNIEPGKAYWVKVNQEGQLILSLSAVQSKSRIVISQSREIPPGTPDGGNMLQNAEIPKEFALHQNYPNPFNPSTLIKYDLPTESKVTLIVYDLLGREVVTLVNETQTAGFKELQWDASNFPSGAYFYRITSNTFSDVKKMVLMR